MKHITINGRDFELHTSKYFKYPATFDTNGATLDDFYKNASGKKWAIYTGWLKWAKECKAALIGVYSGCSQLFTMRAITCKDGVYYGLVITAYHWNAYKLDKVETEKYLKKVLDK